MIFWFAVGTALMLNDYIIEKLCGTGDYSFHPLGGSLILHTFIEFKQNKLKKTNSIANAGHP